MRMRSTMNMSYNGSYAWGANSYGQLGSGDTADTLLPTQCLLGDDVIQTLIQIAGGGGHTVWLTRAGELYSCGWNKNGQLGYSVDSITVSIPRLVTGVPRITKVSCGWNHTLAITVPGELYVWGSNSFGQLGLPDRRDRNPVPTLLSKELLGGVGVAGIAAGLRHSVALNESGDVFTWGSNKRGQLGHTPVLVGDYIQPLQVMALTGAVCSQVAAGAYHTVAVTVSGQVYCWGCNQFSQCGPRAEEEKEERQDVGGGKKGREKHIMRAPCVVQPLPPTSTVCCGWSHTLAITKRRLYGWGRCDYGQLCTCVPMTISEERCDENCNFIPLPSEIQCLRGVQQLASGSEHCIAVNGDGAVVTWGWNEHGMCGTGTETNIHSPHTLVLERASKQGDTTLVGAGAGHSLLVVQQTHIHS